MGEQHDTGRAPRLSIGPSRGLRADAARNRVRILRAADELLASEGAAVALDAIAQRAGVGAGTLHRHFPTKALLVSAVVSRRRQLRVDEAAAALATDGARAIVVLRGLLERLLDDGAGNRALKELLEREHEPVAAGATIAAFHALIGELLEHAQADGDLGSDTRPADIAALLAGALAAEDHLRERPDRVPPVRAMLLLALGDRPAGTSG